MPDECKSSNLVLFADEITLNNGFCNVNNDLRKILKIIPIGLTESFDHK